MKMKKLTAVAMVALLGSLAANATVVFNDTFKSGPSGFAFADINYNLAGRQAAGATSSTYTGGGLGNTSVSLYYDVFGYSAIDTPVDGNYVTLDLDTDFGSSLAGNEWSLSNNELQLSGIWGGWSATFVGSARGFGSEIGVFFRPNGEWFVMNDGGLAAAGAGTIGEGITYTTVIDVIEGAGGAASFTVSQQIADLTLPAVDLGTYATTFAGSSRYVQYRTHFDGGASTLVQTALENVNIEVIPEPATLGLFALIGGGMLWIRKRMAI